MNHDQSKTDLPQGVHEYRVVSGSFLDTDGSVKNVGDTIILGEHDAAVHGGALELATAKDETARDPAAIPMPAPQVHHDAAD